MDRSWLVVGVVGAALFALASVVVAAGRADGFDAAFTPDDPPSWMVDAGRALSLAGGRVVVAPIVALATLWLLWKRHLWAAARVALLPLAGETLATLLKLVFARPRPEAALVEVSSASFPSGHATSAAILACLCVWVAVRNVKGRAPAMALIAAGALWALAHSAGRVVVRAHYPSDVLGGLGLGLAVASFGLVASLALERRLR